MIKNLKNNPILLHYMSHAEGLSPRRAWLIAAGLTVGGLVLGIGAFAISLNNPSGPWILIGYLTWIPETLILVFGPLITGGVAVAETTRAIASDKYRLIRLSPLSEWEIVNGYLACTVFRMRLLWVLAGGLLLPSIVAWAQGMMGFEIILTCELEMAWPIPEYDCTPPIPTEYMMKWVNESWVYWLGCAAIFAVWNWLATTLGLWMAFRYRRKGIGLAVTLTVAFLIIASSIAIYIIDPYWVSVAGTLIWLPREKGVLILSGIALVLGLVAYLMTVKYVKKVTE